MSWINLLLSALLLCNCGFSASLATASGFELQAENGIGNTKLNDVFLDVLLIIFDQLELPELIYLGATNKKFHTIAEGVFNKRYRGFRVRITNTRESSRKEIYKIEKYMKRIEIRGLQLAIDIFKYASKWIPKISIDNDKYHKGERKTINQIVNKYGSESLTYLDLDTIANDTFEDFALPFKAVDELHLMVEDSVPSESVDLGRFFPNLRRLHVTFATDLNSNLVDSVLPRLEYVNVGSSIFHSRNNTLRHQQFETFFAKNKQISSIKFWDIPSDRLKTVNELLPNLQEIELSGFNINETVQFENVKKLHLPSTKTSAVKYLTFPKLEFLDADYDSSSEEYSTELRTFLQKHQNLSSLELHLSGRRTVEHELVDFISFLPNLVEFKVFCAQGADTDLIVQIIQNHKNLVKFQFPVDDYHSNFNTTKRKQLKQFRKQFENEWKIRDMRNHYIIEKKN